MNCLEIIESYLDANGFGGLHDGADCACERKDLFPCGEGFWECTPGYKVVPPEGVECEYEFYICRDKDDKPWERE